MKRSNRNMATVAAGTVLVLGLGACGSGAGSGGDDTLKLWVPPLGTSDAGNEAGTWDDLLAGFEEEHGVDVQATVIPWASYEEKYLTGVSSGDGPDVGYMYSEMLGDYLDQGALAPFDEYMAPETLEGMKYLDLGNVDGKQYGMPFIVGNVRVLYANTEILDKAGVDKLPATWDEFATAASTVSSSGSTGLLQEWGAPDRGMLNSAFFPWLWQAGGDIFTEDGSATAFNSPAGVAAAQQIRDLIDSGAMPSGVSGLSADEVKDAFLDGKTAFWQGDEASLPEVEEAGFDFDTVASLTGDQQGTFVAADSLVMLDSCDDKQLCSDLVAYIEAGEQMAKVHELAAYPPIAADEKPREPNRFTPVYDEQSDMLHTLPIVAGSPAVYNALYENLQQMVLGQKTPEQAMKDAATEGDAAIESAR